MHAENSPSLTSPHTSSNPQFHSGANTQAQPSKNTIWPSTRQGKQQQTIFCWLKTLIMTEQLINQNQITVFPYQNVACQILLLGKLVSWGLQSVVTRPFTEQCWSPTLTMVMEGTKGVIKLSAVTTVMCLRPLLSLFFFLLGDVT